MRMNISYKDFLFHTLFLSIIRHIKTIVTIKSIMATLMPIIQEMLSPSDTLSATGVPV